MLSSEPLLRLLVKDRVGTDARRLGTSAEGVKAGNEADGVTGERG